MSVATYRGTDLKIRCTLPCTCNSVAFTHLGETRACSIDDRHTVSSFSWHIRSQCVADEEHPEVVERLSVSQSTFTFEPMVALRRGVPAASPA
jgi:hypothetical protein